MLTNATSDALKKANNSKTNWYLTVCSLWWFDANYNVISYVYKRKGNKRTAELTEAKLQGNQTRLQFRGTVFSLCCVKVLDVVVLTPKCFRTFSRSCITVHCSKAPPEGSQVNDQRSSVSCETWATWTVFTVLLYLSPSYLQTVNNETLWEKLALSTFSRTSVMEQFAVQYFRLNKGGENKAAKIFLWFLFSPTADEPSSWLRLWRSPPFKVK